MPFNGIELSGNDLANNRFQDFRRIDVYHFQTLEALSPEADDAYIMACKPPVSLEHPDALNHIANKEAQGVRLSYTVTLQGEPNVSHIPHSA